MLTSDEQQAIGTKWVFTIKYDANGQIDGFKARLVVQGFSQLVGCDYDANALHAPVIKRETLRALCAKVAEEDLEMHAVDVKTTFLQGDLTETVYVKQPAGFQEGPAGSVWLLHKPLYGLKQAPRAWNDKLHTALLEFGFVNSAVEPGLYIRSETKLIGDEVFLLVWVDDILVIAKHLATVTAVKQQICANFEARDLGEASMYVGIHYSPYAPPRRASKLTSAIFATNAPQRHMLHDNNIGGV